MPMAPGAGGAPRDEQRSDASGLVSGDVEPWSDAHGEVPGEGEVGSAAGASAGGPGLVHQGTTGTTVPANIGSGVTGADVPAPAEARDHRDHDAVPVPAPFPVPVPQPGSVQPVPPATRGSGAGEVAPVRPGAVPTASRVGVGGVSVPPEGSAAAAEEAALGEAAAAEGAAAREGGMMPPYGMPGGAAPRGSDERSDSSGLLLNTENGWADPEVGDLPGETQGTPAGGATLSGADSAAADELDEGRVAVVPSAEAAEDTSAWGAGDPAMLWALGGRRAEDEEEEELQPKYVLGDDDGWSDEDGAVSEAGVGGDEAESPQEEDGAAAVPEEPGWSDEDGTVFAAGLGFPQPSASSDDTSAEPVTGPGLATWRPDRSQAAAAEELPPPVTGYAGMLLSTAEVPDDEDEDEEDEGPEEDGDEAKSGRGIADLLRQGADSWGAVPQRADEIG
ncbi:hypothetical protein [Streptomyces cyaneus]|uniref:hypothetical protein n=1 Tax=Streptomyces cyaneus TaxID=1904 RepID=UPI000FF88126|nr:hypothetical protein [Streptomyces cyaneus]